MVKEIKADGIIVDHQGQEETLSGFDSIVLALGSASYQPFEENLVKEQYVLGDATKARRAIDALREARELVIKI